MKKLYALCIVTLAAVLFDITFFHSGTAIAQIGTRYRIQSVPNSSEGLRTQDTIVGFSCVNQGGSAPACYALVK
jgi:hypothetical protein